MAFKNCTLNYTLKNSEPCRAPLEDALEIAGWEKTGHAQQTRWTGCFDESDFIKKKADGKKVWDNSKIRSTFCSYFDGVEEDEDVDATFVLTVGNSGDCVINVVGSIPFLDVSCTKP